MADRGGFAGGGAVIRYLDVCSGYSAFTQGAIGLPFECAGYAEIDAFPSAMLGHHYGATRARYMPDPEAPGIDAKERKTRIALRKSMASLSDAHFGNRIVNFGDFTQIREDDVGPVDWLVGGTPCQAFSIAGKRLGLDDPRGNLTLEFLALAKRVRAYGLVWENVPGFLSHDGGRTMGTFLRLLGELGYGFAWRVLDAQYIRVDGLARAVPQRRKRLIVVGCLGNPARAAAILFEPESLRGDSAPRRETGKGVAPTLSARTQGGGGLGTDFDCDGGLIVFGGGNTAGPIDVATTTTTTTTTTSQRLDFDSETFVAQPVAYRIPPNDTPYETGDITGALTTGTDNSAISIVQPVAYSIMPQNSGKDYKARQVDVAQPLMAGGPVGGNQGGDFIAQPVAFNLRGRDGEAQAEAAPDGLSPALRTNGGGSSQTFLAQGWAVRRLVPTECERLMGLSDHFTAIPYRGKPAADGPRYKVLGNSQTRNMMRWIAHGIAMTEPAREAHAA